MRGNLKYILVAASLFAFIFWKYSRVTTNDVKPPDADEASQSIKKNLDALKAKDLPQSAEPNFPIEITATELEKPKPIATNNQLNSVDLFPKLNGNRILYGSQNQDADQLSDDEIENRIATSRTAAGRLGYSTLGDIPLSELKSGNGIWLYLNKIDSEAFFIWALKNGTGKYLFQQGKPIPGTESEVDPNLPYCWIDLAVSKNDDDDQSKVDHFTVAKVKIDKGKPGQRSGVTIWEHPTYMQNSKKLQLRMIGCYVKQKDKEDSSYLSIMFSHMIATLGVKGMLPPQ